MRIVIDMQGAQGDNRLRGIGRYSTALAQAIIHNQGEHEVVLALNGLFINTIEPIRAAFNDLLPQENIRVWHVPGSVAFHDAANPKHRQAAEYIREAFLASLKPDIVLVSSLFEGLGDDAVTSVGLLSSTIPTAAVLYDLIPYIHRSPYLDNPCVNTWYLEKIEHLRRCDLWLAISESSRQEGVKYLSLPSDLAVNVSTDADSCFQILDISAGEEATVRAHYGLNRPFIMYTGGIDHRKNIEGLIRAYAMLPKAQRESYQLAIVCSAQPEVKRQLQQLAAKMGLNSTDLVLTGFVPENHLLTLYNLCSLFVFPSWHEGFGLPALEAMRCGAAVIGANTSSLPEVIGLEEALFDPHSDEDMANKIECALTDNEFRKRLVKNSREQSQKFSWDASARQAITAMECLHSKHQATLKAAQEEQQRTRLAYVSPLLPERSGIADYSAELLPALALHYDIEVIVTQESISDPWAKENCPVRSVQWFLENIDRYDRVLYHFGNSSFHQHMFSLLKAVPGVVVLHDFFLSGVVAHMDVHGYAPGGWAQELYAAHGYNAVYDRFHAVDSGDVVWKYPCSLSVIQDSLGLIVHSPNSLRLAEQWYGTGVEDWTVIPHMRVPQVNADKESARRSLELDSQDYLVCAFGMLGPTKLNHRLLEAWFNSSLANDQNCHLVFVGENEGGVYGQELLATIRNANVKSRVHITGWADKDIFRQYLAAADVGVQLRTQSRGETSGTVLDCMNYGLATIINSNGSMADLDAEAVWKLPDEFSDEQLIGALETLRQDKALRQRKGKVARDIIVHQHDPQKCADLYSKAIEGFYRTAKTSLPALPDAIASIPGQTSDDASLVKLAGAMALSFPPRNRQRQLMVDISELVQRDAKTGIQRVVRNILIEWLHNPPKGYRVEPVYATVDQPYRYAGRFTASFMDIPERILSDELISYSQGDIFLGLDLQPEIVPAQRELYQRMRQQGVQVKFVVYDLLCVLMQQYFLHGASDSFTRWLEVVTESDGAICISQSVAIELNEWLDESEPLRLRPFQVSWFHLGGDIDNPESSKGLSFKENALLKQIINRPTFLMVGTLEPRKGYTQVLDAFEQLWRSGVEVNLVIVGKQGWMVESLVERLDAHFERNYKLIWLNDISDEYLEKIYFNSTCLIAASYGEGFGLPLIEAAQHRLPIIARDIPVFREVAGEYAFYFDSKEPSDLANSLRKWMGLYENGVHPTSDNMPWLTWKESAQNLLAVVTDCELK